jgi:EAL domain-containing protein (putative c-di-GMP-specific phosphodiesterase class I)
MAGELDVVYQPVFDAATRAIVSAEALVRWRRKGHGEVPPDVFVPIAEQSGLVGALGTAVLRRACRDAQRWPFIPISVNVSPAQLHDPMPSISDGHSAETGIEPQRLILEITETYLVSDPVRAKRAIDAVRTMGISVALDDFGTGFSSIGYLRQFTFDQLKLDRSVVADIARNEPARKLIQATVALADALSLSVTAEGVETEDDALLLRLAGCRCLQGFLLSRPISADQLTVLSASEDRAGALILTHSAGPRLVHCRIDRFALTPAHARMTAGPWKNIETQIAVAPRLDGPAVPVFPSPAHPPRAALHRDDCCRRDRPRPPR